MRTTSLLHATRLLGFLLQSLGVASGAAACGGKVFVDLPNDAETGAASGSGGGSASASSSTTTTTATTTTTSTASSGGGGAGGAPSSSASAGGGPAACTVVPPEGSSLIHDCLPLPEGSACLPASAPEVLDAFKAQYDNIIDPGQFCCEPGCAGQAITSVPCGPYPEPGPCCYVAVLTQLDYCMGRPFTVAGEARRAAPAKRSDWIARAKPTVTRLDAPTRAALAAAWRGDAELEHASIASFSRFTLDLLAVGAPAHLIEGAVRAIGEEVRHAELCYGLASAYAGEPIGPSPLDVAGLHAERADATSIVRAAVREGCVGETLAALAATAAHDAAEDEAARGVLATIARDEAGHAALAWRFVAWALEHGEPVAREAALDALRELACEADIPPATAPTAEPGPPELRAHGRLSPDEHTALLATGMRDVVRPCARALLATAPGPSPTQR